MQRNNFPKAKPSVAGQMVRRHVLACQVLPCSSGSWVPASGCAGELGASAAVSPEGGV